jgi:hypothetical protein
MQKAKETSPNLKISERRDVAIILAGVLFVINFLCIYFIWSSIFPEITGILRLVLCWIGAYSMTWFMTYVTKGVSRLVLTIIMVAVQYVIFHYTP